MIKDDYQSLPGNVQVKRAMEIAATGGHSIAIIDCDNLDAEYHAAFNLIGSNHKALKVVRCCPCGNFTHPKRRCTCTPNEVGRWQKQKGYRAALEADIVVTAQPVKHTDVMLTHLNMPGAIVHKRVIFTRLRQHKSITPNAAELFQTAAKHLNFNAKEQMQVLSITNTIMNMDHDERVRNYHIAEAINLRRGNVYKIVQDNIKLGGAQ